MKKEKIIQELLGALKVPEIKSHDEIWLELNSKLDKAYKIIPKKGTSWTRVLSYAAAACVVLAVIYMYPSESFTSFVNDSTEIIYHTLPDGSLVSLSPNSELEYGADADSRDINLKGEAFFEVKKGVPFTVETENGDVSVLGTSFYVTSRSELLDVKCFTGKVKVKTDNAEVFLSKGEGVSSVSDAKYIHSSVKKWEKGDLSFDNVPLSIILEDLKIFKEISVVNSSGLNPLITLELDDETEEEIMKIISTISDLTFQKLGGSKFELYKE